ncbi:hypothetical protein BJ684DRAFT_19233 [Piptocephalis cylindrospora]|uniref:Uncharacterized protein n=1 Tax=Piptocephalis cylindrospora TaxID=1907219 RepID=A0A4P9Y5P4_9FUNG|nr:hypothetical protein BJ684DRAFT_19233 [Piptocephalis cylindrospora]|eukprot:RKP14358.1 hypothetical protein BJ684DRAFT_19233 [Piptocephalis cylindrospora]
MSPRTGKGFDPENGRLNEAEALFDRVRSTLKCPSCGLVDTFNRSSSGGRRRYQCFKCSYSRNLAQFLEMEGVAGLRSPGMSGTQEDIQSVGPTQDGRKRSSSLDQEDEEPGGSWPFTQLTPDPYERHNGTPSDGRERKVTFKERSGTSDSQSSGAHSIDHREGKRACRYKGKNRARPPETPRTPRPLLPAGKLLLGETGSGEGASSSQCTPDRGKRSESVDVPVGLARMDEPSIRQWELQDRVFREMQVDSSDDEELHESLARSVEFRRKRRDKGLPISLHEGLRREIHELSEGEMEEFDRIRWRSDYFLQKKQGRIREDQERFMRRMQGSRGQGCRVSEEVETPATPGARVSLGPSQTPPSETEEIKQESGTDNEGAREEEREGRNGRWDNPKHVEIARRVLGLEGDECRQAVGALEALHRRPRPERWSSAEEARDLEPVYVTRLPRMAIRQLKHHLWSLRVQVSRVHNIAYVSNTTAELLVEKAYTARLVRRLRECDLRVDTSFNPTQAVNPRATTEVKLLVRMAFLGRLRSTMNRATTAAAREYFRMWLQEQEGEDMGDALEGYEEMEDVRDEEMRRRAEECWDRAEGESRRVAGRVGGPASESMVEPSMAEGDPLRSARRMDMAVEGMRHRYRQRDSTPLDGDAEDTSCRADVVNVVKTVDRAGVMEMARLAEMEDVGDVEDVEDVGDAEDAEDIGHEDTGDSGDSGDREARPRLEDAGERMPLRDAQVNGPEACRPRCGRMSTGRSRRGGTIEVSPVEPVVEIPTLSPSLQEAHSIFNARPAEGPRRP